jgi:hypothetical protein
MYRDHTFTVFKLGFFEVNVNCSKVTCRNIFFVCKECDVFPGMALLHAQCSHAKVTVDIQLQVLEKRGLKMTEYSTQLVRLMNCRHILGK